MSRIRCFVLEPTGRARRDLRRYRSCSKDEAKCTQSGTSYHNAHVPLDEVAIVPREQGRYSIPQDDQPPRDDPRWPTHCACGYAFTGDDEWQVFGEILYTRADTGELTTLRDAPSGALWRATWFEEWSWGRGADGEAWICRTPGGDWHIDGPANNCTMPNDKVHKCWCRHGTAPDFTVDKNGVTCAAGAGSIQSGSYHGFLRNGWLED